MEIQETGAEKSAPFVKIMDISVDEICLNPMQPRKRFDQDKLQALSDSISRHGIIQPVMVTQKDGLYHLVAGERRLRAAKLAGIKNIPAVVKDASWEEMLHAGIVENLQREDLTPLEEARAYRVLSREYQRTQEEIAEITGKSRSYIANTIRLLSLPEPALRSLESEEITAGHARALLSLEDDKIILWVMAKIIKNSLSVRQTEELIRQMKEKKPPSSTGRQIDVELKQIQDRLSEKFSAKVEIKQGKGKSGRIEIYYQSYEDLNQLVDFFGVQENWR